MSLTEHQNEVYEDILDFLEDDGDMDDPENLFGLLCGPGGVGKTYLMKCVVRYIRKEMNKQVLCCAPTHKARKVLENIINEKSVFKVPTCTVASLLNKTKAHSYVGTNRYTSDGGNKLNKFDIFIIDETSMISDKDLSEIQKYAKMYHKKILFVGDKYQIPHPTQTFNFLPGNVCEKKDAFVFNKPYNLFELSVIMRQNENNEMVQYYTKIRENLREDTTFPPYNGKEVFITSDKTKFEDKIREDFKLLYTNVIVYTNLAVQHYNKLIRNFLKYKKEFVIDEVLMGYTNVGFPERIIENGQLYIVRRIQKVKNRMVHTQEQTYTKLCGQVLTMQEAYPSLPEESRFGTEQDIFFPEIEDESNYDILMELVNRAEKVNKKNSTKQDFKNYMALKSVLFFRKDLYKFGSHMETEDSFRENHPLLFTHVLDVLEESDNGERSFLSSELTRDLDDKYPKLRKKRVKDNKPLSDVEILADMFQVLEKDIDYGYAITAHKSQGSTIDYVFIDDTDFDRIKDGWNYRMNMFEKKIKEKNQLRYVAYTRASKGVCALTKN